MFRMCSIVAAAGKRAATWVGSPRRKSGCSSSLVLRRDVLLFEEEDRIEERYY